MTSTDRQFITNAPDENLLERFKVLIKDTRLFDVLVGYFYTSGFHALYKSLEPTEKIRILIGISTSPDTSALIQQASSPLTTFTYEETKTHYANALIKEMNESQDKGEVEEGIQKFIGWLRSGKLEIKGHHAQNLHAKIYIMTFKEGDKDAGRVITGSNNFTQAGLVDNLEFNVELRNHGDYAFALKQFNTLWKEAVDVKEVYLQTIEHRTWFSNTITPYQLYLKFLYEYFKESLAITGSMKPTVFAQNRCSLTKI